MAITVFSGTFNPIHTAHLIIAETVRTELNLAKITFIPNNIPPHRKEDIALPEHRMNMIKLAIPDNPYFEVSDIEFRKNEKSYTINTVNALKQQNPNLDEKYNLIIGTDAFKLIDSWYQAEKLASQVRFIIVARPNDENIEKIFTDIRLKNIEYAVVKAPLLDISSSYIRNRIANKKSIRYLVPSKVEEYIYGNELYRAN